MSTNPQLADQLQAMIGKADRSLRAAHRHLESRDHDFASSAAYYAVFHMMQAALLTKGLTFSKHAGVISGFSEHFIKPGIVPSDFGQKIQRLRKDRELGDYGYTLTLDPADAEQDVTMAGEIVATIKRFLSSFLATRSSLD